MHVKKTLACGIQKCMGNLWMGEDFSDFTVVVNNKSFQCHRFILSSCSGFFQGLFRSNMKECQENHVTVGGMTESTLNVILNSVYRGIQCLTKDNFLDVWSATEQLQISYLTKECENFAMKKMTVGNCFSILNHAKMYSAKKVVSHALNFMAEHFEKVRNKQNMLQLSFDDFFKITRNDNLTVDSEKLVLQTIMNWMENKPNVSICTQPSEANSAANNNSNDINSSDTSSALEHDKLSENSDSGISAFEESIHCISGSSMDRNSIELTNLCTDSEQANIVQEGLQSTESIKLDETEKESYQTVCSCNSHQGIRRTGMTNDKKQYLAQLLCACRLFLVHTKYLEDLIMNNQLLLSCREAHNLVFEAIMFQNQVARRHDAWPLAAVHRASSSFKHAMVYLTGKTFNAYILSTGSIHKIAELIENSQVMNFTVFDNKLHLMWKSINRVPQFSIYVNGQWNKINQHFESESHMLLAYGNFVYSVYKRVETTSEFPQNFGLSSCNLQHGQNTRWYRECLLNTQAACLVRFKEYILLFYTEFDNISTQCYNTQTDAVVTINTSLSGTSKNMVSFTHLGDVFLLQANGSLWKTLGSDESDVHFEFISVLWNCDLKLKGSVVYSKQLFVFCQDDKQQQVPTCLPSLPCVFKSIKVIKIQTEMQCSPMVLDIFELMSDVNS